MVISEHTQNSTVILSLSGRFDFSSRKDYQLAVDKAEKTKPSRIVLDMMNLIFVDSSAIGLLRNSHTALKVAGIQLCLAHAQGSVKSVLDLFKMESIIPSYPSVSDACSSPISA